jgi:hypothetical protein
MPLLIGAVVLLGNVFLYGVAADAIVRLIVRLDRSGKSAVGFWHSVGVMMVVTLLTAAAHLAAIILWAGALLGCAEIEKIESFDTAFYVSAQNYTALGYGDVVLSERWRLLGPLESINGLLLFGLSTALMYAVLSRLIVRRLRKEEEAVSS